MAEQVASLIARMDGLARAPVANTAQAPIITGGAAQSDLPRYMYHAKHKCRKARDVKELRELEGQGFKRTMQEAATENGAVNQKLLGEIYGRGEEPIPLTPMIPNAA
jgi:hypothetical protein